MAYLGEEFDPKNIGGIMGVYIAGCGFGAFVGRAVIGTLTDFFSWHTALLGLGAINLLFSLWFWINLPESKNLKRTKVSLAHSLQGLQSALRNRRLLILYTVGFLIMGVYIAMLNYFSLPLRKAPYHLSQTLLGLLYVVNLVGIYGSIYFGRLADRYPRKRVISIGVLLGITGAIITLSNPLVLKIIGLTIFVLGFYAVHTVASGWVGLTASKEQKAQASSLYLLFYYVGSSIVGWSGGLFWTWFGWSGVIWMICGLLILTGVIVSVALRAKNLSLLGVAIKDVSASVATLSEYHKTA
jgi:YNFM family putative membrane transporter